MRLAYETLILANVSTSRRDSTHSRSESSLSVPARLRCVQFCTAFPGDRSHAERPMANPVPPHETNVLAPACPRCSASNARWLQFTSLTSKTDSFQCLACGQTWMEPVEANSAQLKKSP